MKNKSSNSGNNGNEDKSSTFKQKMPPTIRLKLKVQNSSPDSVIDSVVEDSQSSKMEIDSLALSSTSINFGTFKYRPFKLFPLLPPSSSYRVLVPRPYTDIKGNRAVSLNYLWKSSEGGVYTDDSDLVCVALVEGFCGVDEIKGKELIIDVQVLDLRESNPIANHDPKSTKSTKSTKSIITPHNHDHKSTKSIITPRIYSSPHDGYHIRIRSVKLNPSTVHLKRWRKHCKTRRTSRNDTERTEEQVLTPKFKTSTGSI